MSRAVTVEIDSPTILLKEAPVNTKMNSQERSDLAAFGVIVAALLLLVGSWFLTPPASAAQEQPPASVTVASDEVATDSEPEPSGIRGLTVGELLRDAWTAHSTLPAVEMPAPLAMIPEYAASFDGAAPEFPADYCSVPSKEFPGVTHVFRATTAYNA